ncbi:MAG TPA: response regulator [Ferruginibacter sp.]|nr:response regulator [Ferruginibacter sp.]
MILIVDDRPENIFSLKTILDVHSFPTDSALSGEEALKKTLKQNYALIILDVQMPGMDGFEVAEVLSGNNHTKDIPIIFLSAVNTDKKFITKGYSSGAIDYIVKPIDPDILLLKVKTFYKLYEQKRELNIVQENLKLEIEFRKRAEHQALEKLQELHSTLESIPQIAFTASADGVIDFVNEHWYLYAASTKEFPPNHPDDTCIKKQWDNAIAIGTPLEMEVRIKKDGEDYRYHLVRAMPVKEDNKIVKWVGSFTDIDEQKQAIKKKDEFLTIASHELKTPLTSIKAYIQLLDMMLTKEDKVKTYVDRTLLQVNKLDNLINDLLDISKIESGKLKFEMKELDFENLLSTTIDTLHQIHPEYNFVRIGKVAAKINGNDVRIEQVIINFINNAIRYAPASKEMHIITEIRDKQLYFAVKDFGIGISKENQQNVYTKFFRVTESGVPVQGLGIGLYICSEILKRHGATFGVESELGKGATFYFRIPVIS